MTHRIIFPAILAILATAITCMADTVPFDHQLNTNDISFQWTIDKNTINIELSAKTKGWVGIGFNPSHKMKDANFILGYVKNGKVTITDHYGTTAHQHQFDKKLGGEENISNMWGEEADGRTTIRFTIPLDSGDETDQVISPDEETTVLLAYGSGRDSFRTRHKFRTVLKVNLTSGAFNIIK